MKPLHFALLLLLLIAGCAQARYAILEAQKVVIHPIALGAVEISQDTRCDEQPTTLEEARAALTVPIVETKLTRGKQTALPWVMLAEKGFSKQPDARQLKKLRHELRHYCQRRTFACFDQLWATGYCDEPVRVPRSDFRWAFEVGAYRDTGVPLSFVETYLLADLEPASYQKHTQAALMIIPELADPPGSAPPD
jgi:hypothetical protein